MAIIQIINNVIGLIGMFASITSFAAYIKGNRKMEWYAAIITVVAFAICIPLDSLEGNYLCALLDLFVSLLWYSDLSKLKKRREEEIGE